MSDVNTKYFIGHKTDIEYLNFKEGFNSISGKDLEHLIGLCFASDIMSADLSFSLGVDLVIRSMHSNEMFTFNGELSLHTLVKEHPLQPQGYWLLLATIQQLLRDNFEFPEEIMHKTALQPIGIIKQDNHISILFHLISEDEVLTLLKPRDAENKCFIQKIEEVNTFTNLSNKARILLPTIKIVRGGNNERSSDTR